MSDTHEDVCPLCSLLLAAPVQPYPDRDARSYTCSRCGTYALTGSAETSLPHIAGKDPAKLGLLSHIVRRMQRGAEPPLLGTDYIEQLLKENAPPSPVEQVQNLVLWLGRTFPTPGQLVELYSQQHRAIVGAITDDNFQWLLKTVFDRGIINGSLHFDGGAGTLSFDGWQLYQELTQEAVQNRTAFMAMTFGDSLLDTVFSECFKPAVARTGFNLVRLDEEPPAGLIDDRLRVEIRRTRFLIADLTGGNHGAYWEAGFAEGLGKPVIYTCEASDFQKAGTHFDTSHMHTVTWDRDHLDDAARRLIITIRATLPEEATLED